MHTTVKDWPAEALHTVAEPTTASRVLKPLQISMVELSRASVQSQEYGTQASGDLSACAGGLGHTPEAMAACGREDALRKVSGGLTHASQR